MKILFINPCEKYMVKTSFPMSLDRLTGRFPPLNLLYLASYINEKGSGEAQVLDMEVDGEKSLDGRLESFNPDIVGLGGMSFNILSVLKTARRVKEFSPEIPVILGGPHASIFPGQTVAYKNIDYAVRGEGEHIFEELLNAIKSGGDLRKIKGIAFKTEKGPVITPPASPILDGDSLPFPDRSLVSYKKHFNILSDRYPSTTICSGRGCSHGCSFCYHSFGKRVRLRSPANIVEEFEYVDNMGIKDLFFVDDSFGINRKRVIELSELLKARSNKITWAVRIRVDSVDSDLLEKMYSAGCRRLHFGVESGDQETLNALNKGITVKRIRSAIKMSQDSGMRVMANFMIGAPGETLENAKKSIDFALDSDVDFAIFNVVMPYPKTDFYAQGMTEGLFNDFWVDFAKKPARDFNIRYWDEIINEKELNLLLKSAHSRFYLRPNYIASEILNTRSFPIFLKKAWMALGMAKYAITG